MLRRPYVSEVGLQFRRLGCHFQSHWQPRLWRPVWHKSIPWAFVIWSLLRVWLINPTIGHESYTLSVSSELGSCSHACHRKDEGCSQRGLKENTPSGATIPFSAECRWCLQTCRYLREIGCEKASANRFATDGSLFERIKIPCRSSNLLSLRDSRIIR